MKCSTCRTESSGAYCPGCGAPLEGARCKECAAALLPGAAFCTQCGHAVRPTPSNLPWYLAGASLVALLVVLLVPALRPAAPASSVGEIGSVFAPEPAGGDAPGRAPPLSGTPREQADRLFNRVMQAETQGDTAQVAFFLPMAVVAYRQAGELDVDGLYHLGLLEVAAGEAAKGRATVERILESAPDHLLALGIAGRAADRLGDRDAARRYYEHLLAVFEAEQRQPRPEYLDHARILPEYRGEAEAYVARK